MIMIRRQHQLMRKIKDIQTDDIVRVKVCFEALRRIEDLEREVAAKRLIGWTREVSQN